jgi:hypothetical protein
MVTITVELMSPFDVSTNASTPVGEPWPSRYRRGAARACGTGTRVGISVVPLDPAVPGPGAGIGAVLLAPRAPGPGGGRSRPGYPPLLGLGGRGNVRRAGAVDGPACH